jgi:hypothetical protein
MMAPEELHNFIGKAIAATPDDAWRLTKAYHGIRLLAIEAERRQVNSGDVEIVRLALEVVVQTVRATARQNKLTMAMLLDAQRAVDAAETFVGRAPMNTDCSPVEEVMERLLVEAEQ